MELAATEKRATVSGWNSIKKENAFFPVLEYLGTCFVCVCVCPLFSHNFHWQPTDVSMSAKAKNIAITSTRYECQNCQQVIYVWKKGSYSHPHMPVPIQVFLNDTQYTEKYWWSTQLLIQLEKKNIKKPSVEHCENVCISRCIVLHNKQTIISYHYLWNNSNFNKSTKSTYHHKETRRKLCNKISPSAVSLIYYYYY